MVLAAGLVYAGSGTPQPLWLVLVVLGGLVAWLIVEGMAKRSARALLAVRCGAAALVVVIALCELPWHLSPRIAVPRERKLYVVADSISAGLGTAGIVTWPKLLERERGVEVGDLSLAGATADGALSYLEGKALGPGLVVVEIGGNDMIGGRDAEGFAKSLEALLVRLKRESPCVVMLELPVLPGSMGYARAQRMVAARHGVPLIPKRGFAVILTRPGNTIDGLHLSAQGQREMAEWIWGYVRGPLEGR